jgi:hypothetical protein
MASHVFPLKNPIINSIPKISFLCVLIKTLFCYKVPLFHVGHKKIQFGIGLIKHYIYFGFQEHFIIIFHLNKGHQMP